MQGASFVADESRGHRLARPASRPLWVWCLVAIAVFALLELRVDPTRLVTSLGDADDATRLIQVRDLINGASWFDRTLPSIGAPEPLVSHWSRLIDAPLALMLVTFERVMSPATAEFAVRALWPLIVFLPLLFFLAREFGSTCGPRRGRRGPRPRGLCPFGCDAIQPWPRRPPQRDDPGLGRWNICC